ncbi:MAG: hypothetical protein NTU79_07715 [Planctomycetota bacterium]|nr:hypothetical protein [Planctomycetota bacterium]
MMQGRSQGIRFGISISEPETPLGIRGNPTVFVNQFSFQFATQFLIEGGSLIFGQKWKKDGIMFHLADKYREIIRFANASDSAVGNSENSPILNFLAWPDEPPTDKVAEGMIRDGILKVRQIETPGLYDTTLPIQHPEYEFWRVRALTAMRKQLVDHTNVRICIGGASGQATRRLPGIIEEAWMTINARKPLYLIGAIGGAARAMVNLILQRTMSESERDMFVSNRQCTVTMERYAEKYPYQEDEGPSYESEGWSAMRVFQSPPLLEQLAFAAGLEVEEYIWMMTAPCAERAMQWVGKGVTNIATGLRGGISSERSLHRSTAVKPV